MDEDEPSGGEKYVQGEKIFAWHLDRIYEGKIVSVRKHADTGDEQYEIHYNGWKDRWNEVVGPERLLKFTPENKLLEERYSRMPPAKTAGLRKKRASSPSAASSPASSPVAASAAAEQQKKRQRRLQRPGASPAPNSPSSAVRALSTTTTTTTSSSSSSTTSLPSASALIDGRVWTPDMIPTNLKKRLVEDWKLVSEEHNLLSLPSAHPVFSIFTSFVGQLPATPQRQDIVKVVDGLHAYFDKALGSLLLYRFERLQYAEVLEKHPSVALSTIYGPELLLRFFVKLPTLLSHVALEQQTVLLVYSVTEDLLNWISHNATKYFSRKRYEPASPQYLRSFSRQ